MIKNLVIVESPAKAKTIEKLLGKGFTVRSSFGHVMDLSKKELGVDIEKDYDPQYIITSDKKKIVDDLKKIAKEAEMIWLATDEDREGEAISWHLYKALKLEEENTRRIVFHEITKTAIQEAISKPRSIDRNLVNAQTARRVLDRLVGFELSPLLWKKVKPALSAGRVQSVAVRLIAEKEEEIRGFKATESYKVNAYFNIVIDNKPYNFVAELPKRFHTKEEAIKFLETCKEAVYTVSSVEKKPSKKSPAPPFTTSTLQQEASRKLGFSVSNTMRIAQQLYEAGLITYMRTDSVTLSKMALASIKQEVEKLYGEEYSRTRQFTTRTKGAQEAHEAIRPTYINNQSLNGNNAQKKLYELIWKRTIASQMSDAATEKTIIKIDISTNNEKLVAQGEVIKFDGFLKVYRESTDDENGENGSSILPPLAKGHCPMLAEMVAEQKFTQIPRRYTEASLVKKLEELGIGRPSTFAPTISTIQKREYVIKSESEGFLRKFERLKLTKDNALQEEVKSERVGNEKGKLFPTDLGILVNRFLMQYFENIINYGFTASVEKDFDEIARGKKVWNEMIHNFYVPFHEQITETQEKTRKFSGERLLGTEPESGENVYVKIGRYGPVIQIGETESDQKPRFAGLKKGQSMEDITLEEALELFKFPKTIGEYEGKDLVVAIGRFGPYVKHDNNFFSLTKNDDPSALSKDRAIEIIENKRKQDKEKIIQQFEGEEKVMVLNGRYGPYISIGKNNYKIPKGKDPARLSLDECLKIAAEQQKKPSSRKKKKS